MNSTKNTIEKIQVKFYVIIFLLFVNCTILYAQNFNEDAHGKISGNISLTDGLPAKGIEVKLQELNKTAITDAKGNFVLYNIPAGTYHIVVDLIGYEKKSQSVTVRKGLTSEAHLQLDISHAELKEIVVQSTRHITSSRNSDYAAKMPLRNIENPQVYNVIPEKLLREQVITAFDDALKNAPGVHRLWSSTGRPNDGAGYFSMRGFAVQPTMINGVPGATNGIIDPANIESIEAIKGPSGTLYGSSLISFGGLLNIVTKKPYQNFGGELNYTVGSYGLNRLTADVNVPLNKDKTALVRLNTAYHNEGSFMDAGFKKSVLLAPSFSYKPTDRVSFLLSAELFNGEFTNNTMIFTNRSRQLIARTPKELNMDFNRSYTANDITYKTPAFNLFGQMTYKLSDKFIAQTNISRSSRKSNGYYSYLMFLDNSATGKIAANDTLASRYVYYQNATSDITDIQQNFIGDFHIGNFRNRLVAGIDVMNIRSITQQPGTWLFDYVNVTLNNDPRYGMLHRPAVDAQAVTGTAPIRTSAENYTYSAYISNVFNITPKLIAMASIRYDYFDNKAAHNFNTGEKSGAYKQKAFSPKFGLVYQLVENKVSLFANYMNGFRNVPPATSNPPGYPVNMKPQQADQKEAGVKLDLLQHKFAFSASYYDIIVNNITRSITVEDNNKNQVNATIQDGEQRSKGIEIDLMAVPLEGLNIVAGYSYNYSRNVKSAPRINGRRPTSAGPKNLANFWISYTAPRGKMSGAGIGLGGNYAGENYTTSSLATGDFILPAYFVLNAGIFYERNKYRLALKADNLTNKEYFSGWTTIEKQMPRRVTASIFLKF